VLIKHLAHSTGGGQKAVLYLLGERDSKGDLREEVSVLRGDPQIIGQLIDSLKTVHRYTSGVIAWAPSDNPTSDEISAVLDDYERVTFAGLKKNQYAWSAVLHRDEKGVHIHFIIPRVELLSGRSFNPAPPGWESTYDPLRDGWNYEKGWARPDDPLRAQPTQGGNQKVLAWKTGADLRRQITQIVEQRIAAGLIVDRVGIIETLSEIGTVTRAGADHVSVKIEGQERAIRMKGFLYGENFTVDALRANAEAISRRPGGCEAPNPAAAAAAREMLAAAVIRRAQYNEGRYPDPAGAAVSAPSDRTEDVEGSSISDGQIERDEPQTDALAADVATAGERAPERIADRFEQLLELAPAQRAEQENDPERGSDRIERSGDAAADSASDDRFLQDARRLESLRAEVTYDYKTEDQGDTATDSASAAADAARTLIDRIIDQAQRAAHAALAVFERAANAVRISTARTSAAADAASLACAAIERAARRAVPVLRQALDAELDRFKSEISLSDYMQAECGYQLLEKESAKNSKVLRCGGDKIIVTRQQDGHDVYFSIGDQYHRGSIIDFVRKREGINLGQIRKELRGWVQGAKRPAIKRPVRAPDRPEVASKDRTDVLVRWASMERYTGSYLTRERCINADVIAAFGVRQDDRGNACFAHRDGAGVTGWEVKNAGLTGFSVGGDRRLTWVNPDADPLARLVVTEASIDSMSYAQLHHTLGTAYVSVGGSMSEQQREQLRDLMQHLNVPVVLAMDSDQAGDKMAGEVVAMAPPGVNVTRHVPQAAKDWNGALQALQRSQADTERTGSVPRQGF